MAGRPTDPEDYYNRRSFHSILQAVVDSSTCFTDINIGMPGRVHDARVLIRSKLYQQWQTVGSASHDAPSKVVQGVTVPVTIIGDAAYPLLSWLMKPYPDTCRLTSEHLFNFRLSSARMAVERAFGLLKGRWRYLSKQLEESVQSAALTMATCCVLHNYFIFGQNDAMPEWLLGDDINQCVNNPPVAPGRHENARAKEIRDAIKCQLRSLAEECLTTSNQVNVSI